MRCPFCSVYDTRVLDSRIVGNQVRRRRQCESCGERFTTYETVELVLPRVVKRDGNREAFQVEKLRKGMMLALQKRPVNSERIEAAIQEIQQQLRIRGDREIASHIVGELVMNQLKAMDLVAYIRFVSVYLSFDDITAFRDIIEKLEKEGKSQC